MLSHPLQESPDQDSSPNILRMSDIEVGEDVKSQSLLRGSHIDNSLFRLQYVRAMPGEPTPENAEIRTVPQGGSLTLTPDLNGIICDPSGRRFNVAFLDRPGEEKASINFQDFVQVLQAV